jgi:hypothetical protein
MSNRDLKSQAAYLRRRKQKVLRKLKQLQDSNYRGNKVVAGSREFARVDAEMSRLMNS